MSVATLDGLREELEKALTAARDICAKAEGENRDLSGEERENVKKAIDDAKNIRKRLDDAKGDAELKQAIDKLGHDVDLIETPVEQAAKSVARGSMGERFTKSPEFQAFINQYPGGRIPDTAKGLHTPPVMVADGFKDLLTSADTSAGDLVQTQFIGLVDGMLYRPFTIRDAITVGRTQSDTVEFVVESSRTNAAAPAAEATAATGTSGTKPESAFVLDKKTSNVVTIAHWIPATKRILSDASQLRTLIDNFLRDGLEEELEDQIVQGNGGDGFTGIDNTTGVQSQAFDTDILTTARRGRTLVRTVGRSNPNAYLMHPNDWEDFDLHQDNENRYYFGGPMQLGTPRLWGLPVIESEAVPEGKAFVGDFRRCVLWEREGVTVQVSDSHSDFFIRNLVAILAEMRAAFGVLRPAALVELDLTA